VAHLNAAENMQNSARNFKKKLGVEKDLNTFSTSFLSTGIHSIILLWYNFNLN